MKKGAPFEWDKSCRVAFEKINKYFFNPLVLEAPILRRPLILYIATQEKSLAALCVQKNEEGKEIALYYLSRTLVGAELKYSPIEKICLSLIFAMQKLRHYMQAYKVHVIPKANPIKYILSRPILNGRLAKWAMILNQYDLIYVRQKAVKGQALANFLADYPIPDNWEINDDFPGEDVFFIDILPPWEMHFDGAARREGAGAGVVFVSPEKHILPYSFVLTQLYSNNVAKYQTLNLRLQMAIEMGIKDLNIFGDSQLVINQLLEEYEIEKEDLVPYHRHALRLLDRLNIVKLEHVPRGANKIDGALASLAAALALGPKEESTTPVCRCWVVPPHDEDLEENINAICALETNEKDWHQPIIEYF